MHIIDDPVELISRLKEYRKKDEVVALVPTMGFIHQGHLEVVKVAQKNADRVIVSIYVNPTQFNDPKDYKKYPRNVERDEKMLEGVGVDAVYLPGTEHIYPEGVNSTKTTLLNPQLSRNLCGATRQGHFEGVLLVVSKLLNHIQPDVVVFGEKDYQQYIILKNLVDELLYPVSVFACPIIRENSGLAMSSRNARLSEGGKEKAAHLFKALELFAARHKEFFPDNPFHPGMTTEELQAVRAKNLGLIGEVQTYILENTGGTIDYVEMWDAATLDAINSGTKSVICALAVFIDGVRLIDNIVLDL